MANKNREDLKTGFQSMIDRTAPYDGEPLIQKADHQITIGDDLMDSALVKLPTIGSINSPAAAFNVDFDFDGGRDRYDIDSTGSADSDFTITMAGLSDNQTGILNITKKANDTFSFANGLITPFNNTEGQIGQTSIVLFVKVVASNYIVQSGYSSIVDGNLIEDNSVSFGKLNIIAEIDIPFDFLGPDDKSSFSTTVSPTATVMIPLCVPTASAKEVFFSCFLSGSTLRTEFWNTDTGTRSVGGKVYILGS